MRVPFYSLETMHRQLDSALQDRIRKVMESGKFILGPEVEEFEAEWAKYCGCRIGIGTGNGLDALTIALLALGLQPGDQVIVPAHTFIATWFAVSRAGGIPVPVDADAQSMNMDIASIPDQVWNAARFIIPVHLYGLPCDVPSILERPHPSGIKVVEDNAQAQGARWRGAVTGSFGHAAATSFYPGKNIGAFGDAGAIVTVHTEVAEAAKKIRNVGSGEKYVHEVQGFNSRLDTIQAAVLLEKLQHLDRWNEERERIAGEYTAALHGTSSLQLPDHPEYTMPVWHQYVIRTEQRDALRAFLSSRGIDTIMHYPSPPHLQKAYQSLGYTSGSFPVAEKICSTCISLPVWPGLTDEQISHVVTSIQHFFRNS